MAQVEGLHAQLLESRLNPPNGGDFASRLERAVARGRECFERSAKRWVSTGAYAHHYALLRETCDERVVEVAQLQLQLLQDDALATFRGELAMLMASSAEGTYKRAARRLMRRTAKAFAKAAEAASPRTALPIARWHGGSARGGRAGPGAPRSSNGRRGDGARGGGRAATAGAGRPGRHPGGSKYWRRSSGSVSTSPRLTCCSICRAPSRSPG